MRGRQQIAHVLLDMNDRARAQKALATGEQHDGAVRVIHHATEDRLLQVGEREPIGWAAASGESQCRDTTHLVKDTTMGSDGLEKR
jgi:hypothetical protein